MASTGGYDYDFAAEVPSKYICTICSEVLREARLTECCGQHYCDSCLKKWLAQNAQKTCPQCRQKDFQSVLNKEKIREVNELQVYCRNKKDGCGWVGELSAVEEHVDKKCGYTLVSCPNECMMNISNAKTFRRQHLLKCRCRPYTCEYCGHKDRYDIITGNLAPWKMYPTFNKFHYDECANYPLDCPNKCGAAKIKRKDMGTHRDSCELEPIDCPFSHVGCTKIRRRDIDSHCRDSMQNHLLLLAKSLKELAQKNEELAQKNEELSREIEEITNTQFFACDMVVKIS